VILSNQYGGGKSPKDYLGQRLGLAARVAGQRTEIQAQLEALEYARAENDTDDIAKHTRSRNRALERIEILSMFEKAASMRRFGRYELLSEEQIHSVLLTFWHGGVGGLGGFSIDLPSFVKCAKDLLSLALEYYFPGGDVANKVKFFEEQSRNRVVVEGHGCYHASVTEIMVPAGKSVHFYCAHGDPLIEDYSHLSGAFSVFGTVTIPSEVRHAGERVPNYFLGFPAGLTTDASGKGGLDALVINRDRKRWIPLSKILTDPKCRNATEIHWSACRSEAPDTAKLKPGPVLEYDVSKKGAAKVDNGSTVTDLKPTA
jgi:hypothetical protein